MYLNRNVTYVYKPYRCIFFGSFLYASKEMNKYKKVLYLLFFFCRHVKLPTIDSLPLCPVFKGAKEEARKRHPAVPALRATFRFSKMTGR